MQGVQVGLEWVWLVSPRCLMLTPAHRILTYLSPALEFLQPTLCCAKRQPLWQGFKLRESGKLPSFHMMLVRSTMLAISLWWLAEGRTDAAATAAEAAALVAPGQSPLWTAPCTVTTSTRWDLNPTSRSKHSQDKGMHSKRPLSYIRYLGGPQGSMPTCNDSYLTSAAEPLSMP